MKQILGGSPVVQIPLKYNIALCSIIQHNVLIFFGITLGAVEID